MEMVGAKDIQRYQGYHEEDEIDLIDLIRILWKNIRLVFSVIIISTVILIGIVFYMRSKIVEVSSQNFKIDMSLDNFYLDKAGLELEEFQIDSLLLNNNNVNELFDISAIKGYYPLKEYSIDEKRLILKNIIGIKKVNEKTGKQELFKHYSLKVSGLGSEEAREEVIRGYTEILDKNIKLENNKLLYKDLSNIITMEGIVSNRLENINTKVQELVAVESKEVFINQTIEEYLKAKHSKLYLDKVKLDEVYSKYKDERIGIEGLKRELSSGQSNVVKLSDIYRVEQETKTLLMLAIGGVLSLMLGLASAFIKELIVKLKEEK